MRGNERFRLKHEGISKHNKPTICLLYYMSQKNLRNVKSYCCVKQRMVTVTASGLKTIPNNNKPSKKTCGKKKAVLRI